MIWAFSFCLELAAYFFPIGVNFLLKNDLRCCKSYVHRADPGTNEYIPLRGTDLCPFPFEAVALARLAI
jgi:hypothetical protein